MFRKLGIFLVSLVLPRCKVKVKPVKGSVVYKDPVSYIAELTRTKNRDAAVINCIALLFNTLNNLHSVRLSFNYRPDIDAFDGYTFIKVNSKDLFKRTNDDSDLFTINKNILFLLIDEYSSAMDLRNFVTVNNSTAVLKAVVENALESLPSSIAKLQKVDDSKIYNLTCLDFIVSKDAKSNRIKFAFGYSSTSISPVSSLFTVNYTNLATKRVMVVK